MNRPLHLFGRLPHAVPTSGSLCALTPRLAEQIGELCPSLDDYAPLHSWDSVNQAVADDWLRLPATDLLHDWSHFLLSEINRDFWLTQAISEMIRRESPLELHYWLPESTAGFETVTEILDRLPTSWLRH